jgi:hypothetical protein
MVDETSNRLFGDSHAREFRWKTAAYPLCSHFWYVASGGSRLNGHEKDEHANLGSNASTGRDRDNRARDGARVRVRVRQDNTRLLLV